MQWCTWSHLVGKIEHLLVLYAFDRLNRNPTDLHQPESHHSLYLFSHHLQTGVWDQRERGAHQRATERHWPAEEEGSRGWSHHQRNAGGYRSSACHTHRGLGLRTHNLHKLHFKVLALRSIGTEWCNKRTRHTSSVWTLNYFSFHPEDSKNVEKCHISLSFYEELIWYQEGTALRIPTCIVQINNNTCMCLN